MGSENKGKPNFPLNPVVLARIAQLLEWEGFADLGLPLPPLPDPLDAVRRAVAKPGQFQLGKLGIDRGLQVRRPRAVAPWRVKNTPAAMAPISAASG